jgi:hypothetical protein
MNARDLQKRFTEAEESRRGSAQARVRATAKTIATAESIDDQELAAIDAELAAAGMTRSAFIGIVADLQNCQLLRSRLTSLKAADPYVKLDEAERRLVAINDSHRQIPLCDSLAMAEWRRQRDGAVASIEEAKGRIALLEGTRQSLADLESRTPELIGAGS